jgi:hypothetical protein
MAKKKAAKKRATPKKAAKKTAVQATHKKAATKKKTAAKKKGAKKVAKTASGSTKSKGQTPSQIRRKKAAAPSRKSTPKRARSRAVEAPEAGALLEKRTVTIEPQQSGDLIVTEPAGGSIRVHHTVHPDAETTPIPGKSYADLHELGPGTHEIETKRTIGPAESTET